jgi:hypothetical protein
MPADLTQVIVIAGIIVVVVLIGLTSTSKWRK